MSHEWVSICVKNETHNNLMVTGCSKCKCGYAWNAETEERHHYEMKHYLNSIDCDEQLVKRVLNE